MKPKHKIKPAADRHFTPVTSAKELKHATAGMNWTPTDEQKESGDFAKAFVDLRGFQIVIENPAGSIRSGTSKNGQETWHTVMPYTYGEFVGVPDGADGDPVDCFIGTDYSAEFAFIVNQNGEDGQFDEHKIMLAFPDLQSAKAGYMACYAHGWSGFGSITPIILENLRIWLTVGDHTRPYLTFDTSTDTHTLTDTTNMNQCAKCGQTLMRTKAGDPCPNCNAPAGDLTPLEKAAIKNSGLLSGLPGTGPGSTTGQAQGTALGLMDNSTGGPCPACGAAGAWDSDKGACTHCGSTMPPPAESSQIDATGIDKEALKSAAETISHCGDYGDLHANDETGDVFWGMGDSDGSDPYDTADQIESKFKAVKGVKSVQFGDESPAPAGYTEVKYDRSKRPALNDAVLFTDSINGGEVLCDSADEFVITATDGLATGELMKVKQLAMIRDSRNLNERMYPDAAVRDAVERPGGARDRARAGAMLSERVHPEVAQVRGKDVYVDNPERKTGRVDDISYADGGKVYIHRTILNTDHGRAVAAAFKNKKPEGISTRFKMTGHKAKVDGKDTLVADWIDISTWDDVEQPAVPQTSQDYVLLTDAQLKAVSIVPHRQTSAPDKAPTDPASDKKTDRATETSAITHSDSTHKGTDMNPLVRKALNDMRNAINRRAPKADVVVARKAVTDAMEKWAAEDATADLEAASDSLAKIDTNMMSVPGYNSDAPAPTFTDPINIGGSTGMEFAPDQKEGGQPSDGSSQNNQAVPAIRPKETGIMHNDQFQAALNAAGLTAEMILSMKNREIESERAKADAVRVSEIATACDSAFTDAGLLAMPADVQETIKALVKSTATDAASVPALVSANVDAFGTMLANNTLSARGYPGAQRGNTNDPASPENQERRGEHFRAGNNSPAHVTREARPYMLHVDRILAATDDNRRMTSGFNADTHEVKKLRANNMKNFIEPMLDELAARHKGAKSAGEWFQAADSLYTKGESALADSLGTAASDTVTTQTLFSQPTIETAFLIQQFQDCEMLQFAHGIGPGLNSGAGGWDLTGHEGDGKIGSILRIPVELYSAPGGFGTDGGTQYDAMLQTPEGVGIDEASITTVFLPFAPTWKRIAISLTRDVIKSLGNGPLNYPAVARALYHIAADKGRRIDKAIGNEFLQISDDYGAVSITGEAQDLANNSVYKAAAGGVIVNLNTSKQASATVSASDPAVVYGTPGEASNVVAAIRILAGSAGGAAPYCGALAGVTPLCRPRLKTDMDNQGNLIFTTQNPLTVNTPAAGAVLGYLDPFGNVAVMAGGGTNPNYAIDYNNGVVVFTAAFPTLAGGGGVLTAPAFNLSYSYVTNFDNVVVNNPALGNLSPGQYYDVVLNQFDVTAARMGSAPRYVKPNLALMSLNAATWLTKADLFYKQNSPNGTELYPTENYFVEHNGVMAARHNCPWQAGDTRIQLTRIGSAKYALDTPFEVRGPYPATDAQGRIIPKEIYYGEENSLICTPQVTDRNGNIKNPVGRAILLR